MSRLFRNILFVSMCMLLTFCEDSRQETNGLIDLQESRPVLKRKNIDDLTADELATYEHAVKMMKQKSAANIYERTGFLWQAWVHNCTNVTVTNDRQFSFDDIWKRGNFWIDDFGELEKCNFSRILPRSNDKENPGMCEHAKDTFLQWHRAEFYFYEKALQDADPEGKYGPCTKNVTVPYWNFTKRPTGKRYPKAFEDPTSPLYAKNRNRQPLSTPKPYTSPYLLAYQIYYQDWPTFGGYPAGSVDNYGSFEAQIHNPMHSTYVGGYMVSTLTAGLDPIFYAFHSYLDYIFEKWIEEHGTESITSADYFMRGEQDNNVLKPVGFSEGTGRKRPPGNYTKNMGRAEIYFDTRKQGYAYQPGPGGEFIPKAEMDSIIVKHQEVGFTFGDNKISFFSELLSYGAYGPLADPEATFHSKVTLPEGQTGVAKATLGISRSSASNDYSFQADVYLYPQNVKANVSSKDFRDRYLAISTSYWALSGHHDHSSAGAEQPINLTQSITQAINSLLKGGKDGETWQVTLAISSDDNSGSYDFDLPDIKFE